VFRMLKGVSLLLAFAALQACAFVDQEVELGYTPHGYGPAGAGTVVTAAPNAAYHNAVTLEGRLVVGTVRNAMGVQTADVVPLSDPSEWISDAIAAELELAGYSVEKSVDQTVDNAARAVELSVFNVYADQDVGFATIGAISTLDYEIVVKSNGQELARIPVMYSADGSERSLIGDAALKSASLKEALEKSLAEAMPQVLEALASVPTG